MNLISRYLGNLPSKVWRGKIKFNYILTKIDISIIRLPKANATNVAILLHSKLLIIQNEVEINRVHEYIKGKYQTWLNTNPNEVSWLLKLLGEQNLIDNDWLTSHAHQFIHQ